MNLLEIENKQLNRILNSIYLFSILTLFGLFGCKKDEVNANNTSKKNEVTQALDLSTLPEIESANVQFYNENGGTIDLIDYPKSKSISTIRLRLWVNPTNDHSSIEEVNAMATRCRAKGLKIWLTLHYSDTWADPAQQTLPSNWQSSSYDAVKDSVFAYTQRVMQQINPDIIQIGNEINSGILWPLGAIVNRESQFIELLREGIRAVRASNPKTQIMLHYAGHQYAASFFEKLKTLDFDLVGLSYYPKWHGKSLDSLQQSLIKLHQLLDRPVWLAETAYPFTLQWNDLTHNVVGLDNQLITPEYPATPAGQRAFISKLKTILQQLPGNPTTGICYWGAELIAWKGPQSTTGSPWENQALFNFSHQALPAWEVFRE